MESTSSFLQAIKNARALTMGSSLTFCPYLTIMGRKLTIEANYNIMLLLKLDYAYPIPFTTSLSPLLLQVYPLSPTATAISLMGNNMATGSGLSPNAPLTNSITLNPNPE